MSSRKISIKENAFGVNQKSTTPRLKTEGLAKVLVDKEALSNNAEVG